MTGGLYLPTRNQLIVVSSGEGTVIFFDASTYATGQSSRRLMTLTMSGSMRLMAWFTRASATAHSEIESATAQQTATFEFDGHHESFQLKREVRRIQWALRSLTNLQC